MRKTALIIIILAGLVCVRATAQESSDEKLFQEAKLLFFDEKWEDAQEKFEDLLHDYPESSLLPQATFYRAQCLARRKGHEEEAIEAYKDYLSGKRRNDSLAEEAESSIIDLAYELYKDDEEDYLDEIEQRLENPNRVIRYYAAFKLSLLKDKQIAVQAIPVLERIIVEEGDKELRDRAKIALLRISPDALKHIEDQEERGRARALRITVVVEGQREPVFSLNIPWALADLAFQAIPEKDKAALRAEGYDLDKIVHQLTRIRGNIIEIRPRDDKTRIIKIWIE
ncbi:MAG TPA: tetratricopeptide repeat protein [Candidatus Desulfaltia sp.]|nr:tetratricopeptide repeat protein [Candidatus Desulfaltia sp.]